MELSGYPHLENVYSNILVFFLDPGREHGFGSIFLDSLLSVARCEAIQDGEEVGVNREEITGTRKQIDLVISTDTLIVGIENKIYHELHNDLDDYGQHLAEKANGRHVCKILLGLNLPNDDQELSGFKPVTYQEYFDEILRRIGPTLIGSTDRYLRFLLEVIETVNHLTEGSPMNSEMLAFFENNREDVELLWKETQSLKNSMRSSMRSLVKELQDTLEELQDTLVAESQGRSIKQWRYWETYELFETLVHDISIESGFVLTIDISISSKGWDIEVFAREGDSEQVKDWIETQEGNWIEEREEGTRYLRDLSVDLPYDAYIEDVAAQVRPLLRSATTYPF